MAIAMSFNYHEAEVLLNWYENSRIKSERYGASRYDFPQEELLVQKLNNPMLHSHYDPMDVEIMLGWMEKSLGPGVTEGKFYFPLEEEIYKKLQKARDLNKTEIKSESTIKRESAIQYADRLIIEKRRKSQKEKQDNERQKDLQQRIKEKKEQHHKKPLSSRIKTSLGKIFFSTTKKPHQ